MIKKISAILLALVLCLSVVVVPASAAVELGDAKIAFSLEWDKEYYNGGDTAVLSVYMDAADDVSLFGATFVIGLDSSVISQADNPIATVKNNATTADWFRAFYKGADTQLSWLAATIATKVTAANTAEEKELYDHYLKYTVSKDTTGGSHENTGANNAGFNGTDFVADEPICTISFTVSSSVADGTKIPAAITSGSLSCTPVQTYWKYYTNPGNSTSNTNMPVANFDLSQAVATATVGEPAAPSIITNGKAGIRFEKNADGSYAEMVSVRTKAQIAAADLQGLIGGITDNEAVEDKILKAGFVYIADANGTLNATTAQTVAKTKAAKGDSIDNHILAPVEYIQYDGTNYSFTCLVTDIAHNAIATTSFNSYAYIVIDVDGDGVADDGEWYFADAAGNAVSAYDLYDNFSAIAWEAYGWGTAPEL